MKAGKNPPEDINVFIEIPKGSNVKYEFDEEEKVMRVDRILYTAMFYPFNYGFIPETLEEDGDPLDVLVISYDILFPGSIISARPIGVLVTEDEKGTDRKIIAVPIDKIDPRFSGIKDIKDLPEAILNQIKHFYEHYKELEPGKYVKIKEFKGKLEAEKVITEALVNKK
ncbi:inorganic pyrophosphatase [Nanobdella aerobiophila]|uniref:Inorganic pyrophosphatase n=1 Tax=Nanobdella aerobiophila TaxID=2586965 RepID=A0A915WSX8_9ARCH|nr:inorganic diphosphatase [Nanobdella aerobiophila]BBL45642.1 inorganic pyrophosphatase [Nanobdella aerobiophila]